MNLSSHGPLINAGLNLTSALFLLVGWYFIRRQQRRAHRNFMLAALMASGLFLVGYLTYHAQVGHTRFSDPTWFRPYYLFLLTTHILLAAGLVPLVSITLFLAVRGRFQRHRQLARWTWPVWMYVSVTGVVIYLLLYQVFPQG